MFIDNLIQIETQKHKKTHKRHRQTIEAYRQTVVMTTVNHFGQRLMSTLRIFVSQEASFRLVIPWTSI